MLGHLLAAKTFPTQISSPLLVFCFFLKIGGKQANTGGTAHKEGTSFFFQQHGFKAQGVFSCLKNIYL